MKKSLADRRIEEVLARPVPEGQKEVWDQYQIKPETALSSINARSKPAKQGSLFVEGTTARRVVTGFELGGLGFTIVSEPGIEAARRSTGDHTAFDQTQSLEENAKRVMGVMQRRRETPIRNIGEVEPSNPILGHPLVSAARTEMLNLLLSPGLVLVGTPSIVHMTPEFLAALEHRVEYGALEEYVHKTAKNFRRTSKAMAKEMRKSSKRFIKKVAKLK